MCTRGSENTLDPCGLAGESVRSHLHHGTDMTPRPSSPHFLVHARCRGVAMLAGIAVLIASACASSQDLRGRAQRDLACRRDMVHINNIGGGDYKATGCERIAYYRYAAHEYRLVCRAGEGELATSECDSGSASSPSTPAQRERPPGSASTAPFVLRKHHLRARPGYQRHDGLFLRLQLGLGTASMKANSDPSIAIGGMGSTFRLALGGAVNQQLVLFGELFSDAVANPTVEIGDATTSTQDMTVGTRPLGVGVAYYLPNNFYLGGTRALVSQAIQTNS